MSSKRNIPNDGQALTTPDVQRMGDGAASADDRVYEVLCTPSALGAKAIDPLSAETATVNPNLLCIPGAAAGTVQLLPCSLKAGSPSSAVGVALQATLRTALASALFSANSSGSTRYDLVYATVQRVVTLTGPRAIKSTADGTIANNPSVNLQDEPTVTLTILPNVSNVTPLATMPADNNGGASGEPFGSYNFPIALVAIPNGYASAGAITQAMIAHLWSGGFVSRRRVRTYRPPTLIGSGIAEAPVSNAVSARNGAGITFLAPVYILPGTQSNSNALSTWAILDNSIDWRFRQLNITVWYMASANGNPTPESLLAGSAGLAAAFALGSNFGFAGSGQAPGATFAGLVNISYTSSGGNVTFAVDTAGVLRFAITGAPHDAVHGDLVMIQVQATDQLLAAG